MDFIDTALELEVKTIERYTMLADQCAGHEGIRSILNMLISDHKTHLSSLRSWQDEADFARAEPDVFPEIRQLFEDMKSAKNTFSCDINQLKLYQEARDLVLEKQNVYQKIQSRLPDQAGRDWLERLIKEEKKQVLVLNNIIQMVERPEQWLEDAEFSHLDEY
ncbi:MAG: hypothetical protein WBB73_12745 [Candidatus Aminicenantaceae bacterium]